MLYSDYSYTVGTFVKWRRAYAWYVSRLRTEVSPRNCGVT